MPETRDGWPRHIAAADGMAFQGLFLRFSAEKERSRSRCSAFEEQRRSCVRIAARAERWRDFVSFHMVCQFLLLNENGMSKACFTAAFSFKAAVEEVSRAPFW